MTQKLVENNANIVALIKDFVPNSFLYLSGTHKRIVRVYGRLEDYDLIERVLNEYEIDTCFHLGAQAIVQTAYRAPLATFESNIKGTWNILEAVRNSRLVKGIVVASSDKAYGTHERLPYTEEYPLYGRHPYDASKACTDILSQTYFDTYRLSIGIARCGNVYGGGDLHFDRIVPGTIRSVLFDENPVVRSDGTLVRDYFYIRDAVDAYLTLAENLGRKEIVGQAFNFGTEKPTTVSNLANKIISMTHKTHLKPVILNEARREIQEQFLSCEKAKRLLNWEYSYSLDKGLKETISWYKNFFSMTRS